MTCNHTRQGRIGLCASCARRLVAQALGMYYREVGPAQRMVRWHLICVLVFLSAFYVGYSL